ncbi:MAG: hypothetical protein H3Z53_07445 [archaeon]|nr:hypothetical protein [archaeon]
MITGDEGNEERILKALSSRFNGRKQLYWPKPPIFRKTGLRALEAVKVYPSLIGQRSLKVLFLVDQEHIKGETQHDVLKALIGIEIKNVEKLHDKALYIKTSIGEKSIDIYAVVQGRTKCLEENISELLELMGYKVNPDKDDIKKLLREIRKDLEDIIKEAPLRDLERTFPQLIKTLRMLKDSAN